MQSLLDRAVLNSYQMPLASEPMSDSYFLGLIFWNICLQCHEEVLCILRKTLNNAFTLVFSRENLRILD